MNTTQRNIEAARGTCVGVYVVFQEIVTAVAVKMDCFSSNQSNSDVFQEMQIAREIVYYGKNEFFFSFNSELQAKVSFSLILPQQSLC